LIVSETEFHGGLITVEKSAYHYLSQGTSF
jgi:hypothetical protein